MTWRRYKTKYNNSKVEIDNFIFDSKKEAQYYMYLKLQKKANDIKEFEVKPHIILQPSFVYCGKKIRSIIYIADFKVSHHGGVVEIVDVKGYQTSDFKLKWKMLKYKYRNKPHIKLTLV